MLKPLAIQQGRIHGQNQSRTGGQGRECAFSHYVIVFNLSVTDQRTDKASYRVACPRLKRGMPFKRQSSIDLRLLDCAL